MSHSKEYSNYDEIVKFDYTDQNEWKNFVREKILPLYRSAYVIKRLREELERMCKNLSGYMNNKNIQKIFLGGVDSDGNYRDNSLAKFYRDSLGIWIDTKKWVTLVREGIDAAKHVNCEAGHTTLLGFLRDVLEITNSLLAKVGINEEDRHKNCDKEVTKILNNPEKIVDALRTLYSLAIDVLVNYDYHMFFIMNTRSIPRYYIEEAYPKLTTKFDEVAKFLELEKKFEPETKDKQIKERYTVWGHRRNGFADLLYRLNKVVWGYFEGHEWNPALKLIIKKPLNLKKEYYEKIKDALEKIGWKEPSYIKIGWYEYTSGAGYRYSFRDWYRVKGLFLEEVYEEGSSYDRGPYKLEQKITITKLLDDLSPALFLGYVVLIVRGNELHVDWGAWK